MTATGAVSATGAAVSAAAPVFDAARKVADAVLLEGYLLYPYRASAQKNQVRWQFGVLAPRPYAEAADEPWRSRTECLLDPGDDAEVDLVVRFLHLQSRSVERADPRTASGFAPARGLVVDGVTVRPWDEGVPAEVGTSARLADLLAGARDLTVTVPAGRDTEPVRDGSGRVAGRLVRHRRRLEVGLRLSAERLPGPYGVLRLRVDVENRTPYQPRTAGRAPAVRRSPVATHSLIAARGARFLSLLDSPEWARPFVEGCHNEHTFPVLAGRAGGHDVVLSAPIILYDHPEVAPESQGDLYDATEIDEILSLRTLALTDAEKREARATDPRAAAVVDRVDDMPAEVLDRLHGAVRYLRSVTGDEPPSGAAGPPGDPDGEPSLPSVPWWDPGADASVSPESDLVTVGGVQVGRGSAVRLRPGSGTADAQDLFLAGRAATVQAVFLDVDGQAWLAVTLDEDPLAELQAEHGRFRYFRPDEVEPVLPMGGAS